MTIKLTFDDPKVAALVDALELQPDEDALAELNPGDPADDCFDVSLLHGNCYKADGGEYLVLGEDEKEATWDEYLEEYIDECIFHELPEMYRGYFDSEAWKRDARMDGAGHCMAPYDGEEREGVSECEGLDVIYYIYRVN